MDNQQNTGRDLAWYAIAGIITSSLVGGIALLIAACS